MERYVARRVVNCLLTLHVPTEPVVLFDSVPEGDAVNYACFAHPEFSSADGLDIYVSYYQTGSGAQRLTKVQLQ